MVRLGIIFLAIFVIIATWIVLVPVPSKKVPKTAQIKSNISSVHSPEGNIEVLYPENENIVSSPLLLKGKARVFENIVSVRLTSGNGTILFQNTAYAQSLDAGGFGEFKKEIIFNTDQDSGVLEVFQSSPKDGSEIDKVSIPLRFKY